MSISGNTTDIKKTIIGKLEEIKETTYPKHLLVDPELSSLLALISDDIKREIAIYIDRHGNIKEISIGDKDTAPLKREQLRRGSKRLSGLRCIHTHPSGDSTLSGADMSSLLSLRLDAMVALGVQNQEVASIQAAFISPAFYKGQSEENFIFYGPFENSDLNRFPFVDILNDIDRELLIPEEEEVDKKDEKTLLIGFKEKRGSILTGEDSLKELEELARTAGASVAAKILINLAKKDSAYYIGTGKVHEVSLFCQQESIDLVVFDDELSPRQQRNLEEGLNCRVIDRSALILQIFADRARTKEGKLQVELAQLNYLLPRLTGYGGILSRLGGGIGTRGPGETKLETDKRHIHRKINDLNKEIDEIKKQRQVLRQRREANDIPVVALVGYTNAGKSSLLNTLTNAGVLAEDKLFATLDPTTRRLLLSNQEVLIIDTVGFINKLPHQLVASFRATLEEIKYADIVLHVVDASNPVFPSHIKTVEQVLLQMEVQEKPTILIFNKCDLLEDPILLMDYMGKYSPSLEVSALTKHNIPKLIDLISLHLPNKLEKVELLIPFNDAAALNNIYKSGEIINTVYGETGIFCEALLNEQWLNKMQKYIINKEQ